MLVPFVYLLVARLYFSIPIVPSEGRMLLVFCILLGMAFGCNQKVINVDYKIPLACVLLDIILRRYNAECAYICNLLVVLSLGLWLGTRPWFCRFRLKNNISLGMFLLSFPVQQVYASLFCTSHPIFNFVLSTLTVIPLAYISAITVEKFCYKMADKLKLLVDPFN